MVDGVFFPSVKVISLSSDENEPKILIRTRKLVEEFLGVIEDIGVIASAEPFVGSNQHQTNPMSVALNKKWMADRGKGRGEGLHEFLDLLSIGSCRTETVLSPFETGDGDHLHGASDLLDADHTPNSPFDFLRPEHLFKTLMEEWNVGILE